MSAEPITPDGCGVCGDAQHHHGQQYHPAVGGNHGWQKPTDRQRLERMKARRATQGHGRERQMTDFEITVRVHDVSPEQAAGLAQILGIDMLAVPAKTTVSSPQRVESGLLDSDSCRHCPDGHQPASQRPWSAWVTETRDGDGQPTAIHVARPDCAHVAESDAQWIRDVLNGRAARGESRVEFGARFEGGEVMARPSRELAERTVQAINGRGGDSALMSRHITTGDWTEVTVNAEESTR